MRTELWRASGFRRLGAEAGGAYRCAVFLDLVHDNLPVLAGDALEQEPHSVSKGEEVRHRRLLNLAKLGKPREVEAPVFGTVVGLRRKQLHAQDGEERELQEQQRDDVHARLHGHDQGAEQRPQGQHWDLFYW